MSASDVLEFASTFLMEFPLKIALILFGIGCVIAGTKWNNPVLVYVGVPLTLLGTALFWLEKKSNHSVF